MAILSSAPPLVKSTPPRPVGSSRRSHRQGRPRRSGRCLQRWRNVRNSAYRRRQPWRCRCSKSVSPPCLARRPESPIPKPGNSRSPGHPRPEHSLVRGEIVDQDGSGASAPASNASPARATYAPATRSLIRITGPPLSGTRAAASLTEHLRCIGSSSFAASDEHLCCIRIEHLGESDERAPA